MCKFEFLMTELPYANVCNVFLLQIAEMYSFLPREAVTHFLMSCTDCQKRMHLGAEQQQKTPTGNHDNGHQLDESISSLDTTAGDDTDSLHIDYSLPITTTYLKHMRSLGYSEEDALNPDREVSKAFFSSFLSQIPNFFTPSASFRLLLRRGARALLRRGGGMFRLRKILAGGIILKLFLSLFLVRMIFFKIFVSSLLVSEMSC